MSQQWEKGFEEVRKRQATKGLLLTPQERLQWLYQTLIFVRKYSKKNPKE